METNQNTRDGRNQSLWQKNTTPKAVENAFNASKIYDVLVVGAGITGITTALLLQKAGLQCIIAEAHNPGYGTTGGTSAHINTFADTTFAEVESAFSEDAAKQFAESIAESVQLIHELVHTYRIDCDLSGKEVLFIRRLTRKQKNWTIFSTVPCVPGLKSGLLIRFLSTWNIKKQLSSKTRHNFTR